MSWDSTPLGYQNTTSTHLHHKLRALPLALLELVPIVITVTTAQGTGECECLCQGGRCRGQLSQHRLRETLETQTSIKNLIGRQENCLGGGEGLCVGVGNNGFYEEVTICHI